MYGGRGRGRGYGSPGNGNGNGRDRGRRPSDDYYNRGGNDGGGDDSGRRRHRDEDESSEANKRQRSESYGESSSREGGGPSSSRGDGNNQGRGGHRGKREWLSKEDHMTRIRKENAERKQQELLNYDNVKTLPETFVSKIGSAGTPENTLVANFFKIRTNGKWILHNYHVSFEPEVEMTHVKKGYLRPHNPKLGGHVFDGSQLYSPKEYSPDALTFYSKSLQGEGDVKITLKRVGSVEPGDVQYLQIYAIIVRNCLRILGLDELGRHFFDRTGSVNLNEWRLEIWPGYSTAIRNHDGGIFLNMDLVHKVLRIDTCLERIRSAPNNEEAKNELIGNIVITHYNRKTYKVTDIDWEKSPMSTFMQGDKEITFLDYYRQRYPSASITDRSQPLLISKPSRKDRHRGQKGDILLIPELCNITGLSDQQRSNFHLMKAIHTETSKPPTGRMGSINNFMKRLSGSADVKDKLTEWGMKLVPDMVSIPGRKLPAEKLFMLNRGREESFSVDSATADWTKDIRNFQMHSNIHLKKWAIIVQTRDSNNVGMWINEMRFVSRGLNFRFDDPEMVPLQDARQPMAFADAIRRTMGKLHDCQMIFVILPSQSVDTYSAVKRVCNIDFGIQSQCFLNKHFNNKKGLKSIATKVVIQMNAKLGGVPWIGTNPWKSTHTMIVGFDVHHSGKGKNAVSIGAVVATTNNTFSSFYSAVSRHDDKEALSKNLCSDFGKCLRAYQFKNKTLPDRIIMYRDGVGQGDLEHVHNVEIAQILESMRGIYDDKDVKFNFVVVTKKGNARILTRNTHGYIDNPGPGTIVDSVITLPERYDFFLISQQARLKQTVSPTTYNVLREEGMGADKIQRLTHKLTHFYFNWTGTVAVPHVCQYAHKLSYLTGIAYKDLVYANERLAHSLYFL